ncbi:MAG: PAS domain S-box protein [Methanoregula sp.]|nr:PAS domain S-box protein [Methanoregula sp.]
MAGPDKEQDHGLIQTRAPTPGDPGRIPEWIYSERGWLVLIIASTAAVLLFSVYCLSHGITIIFMHLFYFPIVLLVYRYRYRGLIPAVLLSFAYVALVYFYDPGQSDIIIGTWYRFLVFVGIAAVVAYLSEQLMTGRKALEESEQKLKLHADFTTDWEFWTDTGGKFVYITPSCMAITGYAPDEFYTDPGALVRIIHPDDRAAFTQHQETYRSPSRSFSLEFRIIRKDGQTRWIEHVCQSMYDPQGNLIGRRGINRDITKRTGFEGKIRLQNQIFETIAEGINLVRTGDGVIVYTNSKFDRMFGYEKGELTGKHVSVVNAPDDKLSPEETDREIMSVLNDLGEWRGELKNIRKDGTTFWCLAVISTFKHPEFGNVWISAHTDITARKLAEESVRKSFAILKGVVESPKDVVIFALDRQYRYTAFNENHRITMKQIWGADIVLGNRMLDYIRSTEDREKAVINFNRALIGESFTVIEVYGDTAFERRWYEDIYNPVTDENGNVIGLTLFLTDITERKTAEEALKESEQKFREIFNNINDAIELHEVSDDGLPGKYLEVNEVTCRMLGYTREELLQHSPLDFTTEYHNRPIEDIGKEIISRGHSRFETGHRNRNGTIIPVEINAHVLRHDDKMLVLSVVRDITERKRAEEALRELDLVIQHSPAIAFVWRAEEGWPVEFVSDNIDQFGYTADNFLSGNVIFSTIIYPEDLARVAAEVTRYSSEKGREHFSQEYRIITAEKKVRWIDDRTWIRRDDAGRITHYQGIVLDITERKQIEDDLRQSEERFRTLSETSLTGIYIFLDGVIRYVNPTFAGMYGYTPEEMIGMDPMTLVHPEDRALVRDKMQGRLDHKEEISVYECRMVTRDNRTIHVSIMGALIPFQGRPAISGNLLDITERKVAEEALRESEERYRILFDESPISLWEEDFSDIRFWMDTKKDEGVRDFKTYFETHPEDVLSCVWMVNVTRINHATMALFGAHSLQEFSGGLSSVFTPESYDTFREELIAISMGKTWFECEIPLQTVSGERKIVLLKTIVVPGFEQTLKKVVISLLDITERKKMEDALRQANKKITMLSSITRHDIKNQLLALRGFLGLSQMKATDPELLNFMKKEERAAEAITNQIEFTKFYEDIGVKAPEWQDIAQIIQTARSQLPLLDTVEFAADLPSVKVFADSLIEKVFYNLMENTLRHGERVSRIRFSFHETAHGAEIMYEDNGVGISHEDKQHLFQKGFGKNTGLGLFLSREILAITGLTIEETGEPGKGVRFVIAIPRDAYRFSLNE